MIFEFDPKKYRFAVEIGIPGKLERLDKIPRPRPDEEVAMCINWNVFDWEKNFDGYGEIEQDGVQYKPPSQLFPSMSFKDGKLVFGDLPNAQVGVGIAMTLVLDGKVDIRNPANMATGKNKRTACGQKANGNILFVTVDNMTSQELAEYMLSLGCINAFQGDSGGSTGYYDGKNLYDQGRAIAAALVAYRKKEVQTLKKKVYISPSTQEKNIGVGNYGTEEMRMNQLADIVCPLLEYNGFEVRRNRPEMTLSQVIADSDAWKPDIHVAIHSNAANGKARGCEVWGYLITGKVTNSQRLSEAIYKELSAITPTADRGVKNGVPQRYAEIVTVKATSCIVEIGFHDNLEDALWIMNNMPAIADAIVKGVCNYFGVTFRKPVDAVDWKARYEALVKEIENLFNKYKGA